VGRRFVAALIGVAALALVGVGCGSSDDDSGPTKAEFTKEASAVCAERVKQMAVELKAASKKGASPDATTEAILSNLGQEVEELKVLEAPVEDEQQIEEILHSMRKGVDEAQREIDKGGVLFNSENQLLKAGKAAEKYGLEHCASLI
jgi:hypothetical protein